MVSLWEALFVTGLLLGGTRFNTRITVWFRDNVPFLDRFNIHIATAMVVVGLLGILMSA